MPDARRKVGEGKEACRGLVLGMILTVCAGRGGGGARVRGGCGLVLLLRGLDEVRVKDVRLGDGWGAG